jgi:hypothetical protein
LKRVDRIDTEPSPYLHDAVPNVADREAQIDGDGPGSHPATQTIFDAL